MHDPAATPAERRRSATQVLRATTASNRVRSAPSTAPRGGGGRVFEAGGGSEGSCSRAGSSPTISPSLDLSVSSPPPTPPPSPPLLPPDAFPDLLTGHALDTLRALEPKTPEAAADALAPYIDDTTAADAAQLASLAAALADILPLVNDPTLSSTIRHVFVTDHRASKAVHFTDPAGHTRTCTFHFQRRGHDNTRGNAHWRIVSISPPDTG
jgi:hypothetical protein